MRRKYFINYFEENREYFLRVLGAITVEEFNKLKNGEVLEKHGHKFYIENYEGL